FACSSRLRGRAGSARATVLRTIRVAVADALRSHFDLGFACASRLRGRAGSARATVLRTIRVAVADALGSHFDRYLVIYTREDPGPERERDERGDDRVDDVAEARQPAVEQRIAKR